MIALMFLNIQSGVWTFHCLLLRIHFPITRYGVQTFCYSLLSVTFPLLSMEYGQSDIYYRALIFHYSVWSTDFLLLSLEYTLSEPFDWIHIPLTHLSNIK